MGTEQAVPHCAEYSRCMVLIYDIDMRARKQPFPNDRRCAKALQR
jgi:hypothetical protein